MDEIVILKYKAGNKETSSNHELMRSSVEMDQQRAKRETKITGIRQKAEAMQQEFEANSTALARRMLLESVTYRQDVRARNEQLHEDMLEATRKHDIEKSLSTKYQSVIQQTDESLLRLRDIINSSKFIGLKSPLTDLRIEDAIKFYSQLTYQMLSLNSKFTTLSEAETVLTVTLRKLIGDLRTLRDNTQEYSDLAESINRMWTALGREPLVLEGQFVNALSEVANEPRMDENLKRSEEFICVMNLSGNEMARRMMSLLSQIEKCTAPLPITMSSTVTALASLLKPAGQKLTLVPPTPELKKLKIPLIRKNTYNTPMRTPLSFGSLMQGYSRSASVEDSEVTDSSSIEMVSLGLGTEALREIMNEELSDDSDMKDTILGIFSEVQTVRLFIDKTRFRDILQSARCDESKENLITVIVSNLIFQSNVICNEKFQKRTDLLRSLLTSVGSAIHNIEQHIASKGEVTESELYRQKSVRLEFNDCGDGVKMSPALFEAKGKANVFQSYRRMSSPKHVETQQFQVEKESIFSGTEVEETEALALQTDREFFKTRGASLIPGLQRKTIRSKSTDAGPRKFDRLQHKGSEFEHGLLEQTQAISQRIKTLVDSGTV